jgi:hypothetical protein
VDSWAVDQIPRNNTQKKGEFSMKKICFLIGLFLMSMALTSLAAEQTWTGKISDSMCGASSHKAMEHGGKKTDAHDCTVACVKGGAKYVFVSKGKVFEIENQDLAGLEEHAGHTVKLTGDLQADKKTIKASKVVMASGSKKSKPA